MDATKQTLEYYNENSKKFLADTTNVEFGELQSRFVAMLPVGGRILDLGCGSGRDSLAFLKAGFDVDAVDGSGQMVEAATKLTGLDVVQALFDEYEPAGLYDGIWACSSLLHVAPDDLPRLIEKYSKALKPHGVFYLSFKLGDYEGMRNGRWFTDLTEESFRALIDKIVGLEISEIDITSDVRPGRSDEKWLNAWCVRS
ncbi:bifunctional 2-polyprenyl-6-hydroxyphenol methylase/3-demethylubiquinol 3-O-methyltransferase UbiG [Adlercreutzia sp. ZJ154]|uniref:class I SAM-dependent methyltransferase n=1 Tax=Adlercreutzia sp. ZJ154 TaxID=2709790 RepID=UPI0013EDF84C|nr:class I SAM-dependent methyltransferase [Adlercreutzia sp. ZJ154]